MISQKFNKIYVIESLRQHDKKTGSQLYNDIIRFRAETLNTVSEFISIKTVTEFVELTKRILVEVKSYQILPIIHIEAHGNSRGLELTSDFVTVDIFLDELVGINTFCRNNLLLTVAACEGAYLTDRIFERLKKIRAPFWGIISPNEIVGWPDLRDGFTGFYDELLRTLNFDIALTKLDNRYEFRHCLQLFVEAYKQHKRNLNAGDPQLIIEKEKLVAKLKKLPQYQDRDPSEIRLMIERELTELDKENFEIMKRSFFMFDLYPENVDRFKIDYEMISSSINTG